MAISALMGHIGHVLKPASEKKISAHLEFLWVKTIPTFLHLVRVRAAHQPHVYLIDDF